MLVLRVACTELVVMISGTLLTVTVTVAAFEMAPVGSFAV
jgi:hypothetical protein